VNPLSALAKIEAVKDETWRWRSGRLGERCGDCGDSLLQNRSVAAEPDSLALYCTRCTVAAGLAPITSYPARTRPRRQLEFAA
jgi:hypothetical protein